MLLGAIGFFTIASFSVTVVLGQAYLPNHLGLASGVTLGLAIGLGGRVRHRARRHRRPVGTDGGAVDRRGARRYPRSCLR